MYGPVRSDVKVLSVRMMVLSGRISSWDVGAYLKRIGLSDGVKASADGLERLQRAHMSYVPFENLDVFHHRGVDTGVEWSVPKIVARRRGGWCYELNGAFAALLEELGFVVKRLGATVLLSDEMSTVPDHLTINVTLDRRYLVDVGFGDSFIRPLPLDSTGPHDGGVGEFGFVFDGDETTLIAYGSDGEGGVSVSVRLEYIRNHRLR